MHSMMTLAFLTHTHTHTYGLVLLPVVEILMPSFCQLIVGLGEPVALQGRVTGLLRVTSRVEGWDLITGTSSNNNNIKNLHLISTCQLIQSNFLLNRSEPT